MHSKLKFSIAAVILICLVGSTVLTQSAQSTPKPAPAPTRLRGLIGEYGPDDEILIIFEKDGQLWALFKRDEYYPLNRVSTNTFELTDTGPRVGQRLVFVGGAHKRASQVTVGTVVLKR